MYNILEELNKTSGIKGSMLVGNDGIIIAADLDTNLEDEALGALTSSIVSNVSKAMERLEQENPQKITIEGENSKIFLNNAGVGILAVVTEPSVNIGMVRLEIKSAISKLNSW